MLAKSSRASDALAKAKAMSEAERAAIAPPVVDLRSASPRPVTDGSSNLPRSHEAATRNVG
jgi:hypothetical protein